MSPKPFAERPAALATLSAAAGSAVARSPADQPVPSAAPKRREPRGQRSAAFADQFFAVLGFQPFPAKLKMQTGDPSKR